eukprot:Skav215158  [mRNA]  locus=scaffold1997:118000:119071:+ [translate_table: standard]
MFEENGEEEKKTDDEEIPKCPAKDPDYLQMALDAEAAGLQCEVGNPQDDLRRDQLLKKQQDRAKKSLLRQLPWKTRLWTLLRLPWGVASPLVAVTPAAGDEEQKPKKKRVRGTGQAKGRPRKKDDAEENAEEEADPEADSNLHRHAKRRAKARARSNAYDAFDPQVVKELKVFMADFRDKKYDKTKEVLHKIPGFNVYDKNRHAAGWKVPLPSKKGGHQVCYFSLTMEKACSVAVNVWLTRKFYDKMKAENLDIAWTSSEEGLAFYRLLVYTARRADSELN